MQKIIYTVLAGALLLLQSCSLNGDNTYEKKVEENEQAIQEYITKNQLQVKTSSSGLRYNIITSNPTGRTPQVGDQIVMSYVGKLTNGSVFDTARKNPNEFLRFPYSGGYILAGIDEVAKYMKSGDSAVAIMPFYLGFGGSSSSKIPAYSVLVFDLKMQAVQTESQALVDYANRKGYKELQQTSSGLYYQFTKKDTVGTGIPVNGKSSVTVSYKGKFLDGYVFDSTSAQQTRQFALADLIPGFSEGLKLMKTKESAVFLIPSSQGYGKTGRQNIPPYMPLVFEVTVETAN